MGRAGMQVVEIDGTIYFMGGDHDKPVFQANWEGPPERRLEIG